MKIRSVAKLSLPLTILLIFQNVQTVVIPSTTRNGNVTNQKLAGKTGSLIEKFKKTFTDAINRLSGATPASAAQQKPAAQNSAPSTAADQKVANPPTATPPASITPPPSPTTPVSPSIPINSINLPELLISVKAGGSETALAQALVNITTANPNASFQDLASYYSGMASLTTDGNEKAMYSQIAQAFQRFNDYENPDPNNTDLITNLEAQSVLTATPDEWPSYETAAQQNTPSYKVTFNQLDTLAGKDSVLVEYVVIKNQSQLLNNVSQIIEILQNFNYQGTYTGTLDNQIRAIRSQLQTTRNNTTLQEVLKNTQDIKSGLQNLNESNATDMLSIALLIPEDIRTQAYPRFTDENLKYTVSVINTWIKTQTVDSEKLAGIQQKFPSSLGSQVSEKTTAPKAAPAEQTAARNNQNTEKLLTAAEEAAQKAGAAKTEAAKNTTSGPRRRIEVTV